MLKLIVSNADLRAELPPQPQKTITPDSRISFAAEVRLKGSHLYEMMVQDPSHYLNCDLVLEREESYEEYRGGAVICHFPKISDEQLKEFIEEDDTLYEIIMIQFQMKILEQLLLFCANHHASKLIIYTDDAQAEELGIYQDFLIYQDQTCTENGEQMEMIISTDQQTFDAWVDFMKETNLKFQQELWREQRSNPTIRDYLKSHPLG